MSNFVRGLISNSVALGLLYGIASWAKLERFAVLALGVQWLVFLGHGLPFNSEKYYGANLFQDRAGYEETRRGYYLPHFQELATAGRSIQHFVSQAAVGMPVCFFNPTQTISRRGP